MPHRSGWLELWERHTSSTEIVPPQCRGYARACARRVLRVSSSRASRRAPGTTPACRPSAHVSHPLTAYQDPPTKTALLSPVDGPPASCARSRPGRWTPATGRSRSSPARAPTPGRRRRSGSGGRCRPGCAPGAGSRAPASSPHGCGSPKIAPLPIWRSPAYPREYQPRPVHSRRVRRRLRAPALRSRAAKRAVAAQVRELRRARVDVGELSRHERRLGHLQERGREVRPVAGAAA